MTTDATPANVGSNDGLGPLPEARKPDEHGAGWFTAGQMRAYAEQERAAERERAVRMAGELQALRNHVAYWKRAGIDRQALARADEALRDYLKA